MTTKQSAAPPFTENAQVIIRTDENYEMNNQDDQVDVFGGQGVVVKLPKDPIFGQRHLVIANENAVTVNGNGHTIADGLIVVPSNTPVEYVFHSVDDDDNGEWVATCCAEFGHNSFPCPCHPAAVGCDAVKSPYFIQVCRTSSGPNRCQPTTNKDGVNIFVQDIGTCVQGTIVLVEGVLGTDKEFANQIDALASQGFRVIDITLRGCGDSDQPFGPYNYDQAADDIRQILDCLDVSNITLLGYADGAGAALHYAARHCGCRLRNLILAACQPINPATMGFTPAAIAGIIGFAHFDFPFVLAGLISQSFFPLAPSIPLADAILIETWKTRLWSFSKIVQNDQVTSPLASQLAGDMPLVTVPTLILHGDSDAINPPSIATALNAGIAGSTLILSVGQGHSFQITDFAAFNSNVAAFAAGGGCP